MASDPFEVQPPAWLSSLTSRRVDTSTIPSILGLAGASLIKAATGSGGGSAPNAVQDEAGQQPEDAPAGGGFFSRFSKAFNEGRANMADPMWKIKATQAQVATLNGVANLESTWMQLNDSKNESAAWLRDMNTLKDWRDKLKDDPATPPPIVESNRGRQMVQTMETAVSRMGVAKAAASDFKSRVEYLSSLDPAAAGQFQGFIGKTPSQDVLDKLTDATQKAIETARKRPNNPDMVWQESQGRYGPTFKEVQNVAARQRENQETRQDQWFEREAKRFTDRVDLEKLKSELKSAGSEEAFISRHLDAVKRDLEKSNDAELKGSDGRVDPKLIADAAVKLLKFTYQKYAGTAKPAWLKSDAEQPSAPPGTATVPTTSGKKFTIEGL